VKDEESGTRRVQERFHRNRGEKGAISWDWEDTAFPFLALKIQAGEFRKDESQREQG